MFLYWIVGIALNCFSFYGIIEELDKFSIYQQRKESFEI